MARSCGLRVGPRRFELVVLEGSPKKSRIAAWAVGDLPRPAAEPVAEGGDPTAEASAVLQRAVKEHSIPTDNVGLAIDTGLAAFRNLKMPFADKAKIEQVLKFEVESLLPQWSIDDVVVDFHTLEATNDSSELLITAVRKADLRRILDVCGKAGVEPQEAEIEATAMVNAALASGICKVDNAQILAHVGELSTSVVIMDGAKVREMRAIHLGAFSHELPATQVAAEGDSPAAAPAEGAEPEPEAPVAATDPAEAERRLEQAIRRIRRELGRSVSAARTLHPIEAIYVCGLDVPGLVDGQVLDVPVRALDVFGPEGGQPEKGAGELVVAYGAALRQMGGGELRPSLRREELRYTGAFERLELPLAVVSLLLVTLLGVWNIFLFKDMTFVDAKLGVWRDQTKAFLIGDIKKGRAGVLKSPSEDLKRYLANLDADANRTKFEQLQHVRGLLQGEVKKLEKDLGQDTEITQPQSALTALTLVLDVLEKQGSATARPSLRKVTSVYQRARSNKADNVKVTFDVTFFADSPALATNYYEAFVRELRSRPWFVSFEERPNQALDDSKGISLIGIGVTVDVTKAPAAPQ
jgi:Tfp pilus assembly PilM family ATPase